MLQLSLDGRRLYVTNSLYSTWDDQFYPHLRSWMMRVNCDPGGGMEIDRDFFVDFHDRPAGPPAPTRCDSKAGTARPRSSNEVGLAPRRHTGRGGTAELAPTAGTSS